MRVWVDLSNSPHVELFGPILRHLAGRGDEVLLTARNHAQTVELALRRWPGTLVVGGPSPGSRPAKAAVLARRAAALARLAAGRRVDVALSHGSYAQIVAAAAIGVPAVTMMDYEFQPANHLSFRLARRVLVPDSFPDEALRRFGADGRALRYPGYKEELYLAGFSPDPAVLDELRLDAERAIVVLRPPPDGSLYHQMRNLRFEEVARAVAAVPGTQAVLLARAQDREDWLARLPGAIVPESAVDAPSLLALADLTIGAGGTMNRESALLGTPTYTVFAGRLAAVDAALIREGRLTDLRHEGAPPSVAKRPASSAPAVDPLRRSEILAVLDRALAEVSGRRPRRPATAGPGRPRRPLPAGRRG